MFDIDLTIISTLIGIFAGLGILIAGIGYAYAQYKSGAEKAKDNLILTLQETAQAEKTEKERLSTEKTEMLLLHQGQIAQLTRELAELRGRFDEQGKKTMEYKEILQGRDPGQLKYMREMEKLAKLVTGYIIETRPILQKLNGQHNKKFKKGGI